MRACPRPRARPMERRTRRRMAQRVRRRQVLQGSRDFRPHRPDAPSPEQDQVSSRQKMSSSNSSQKHHAPSSSIVCLPLMVSKCNYSATAPPQPAPQRRCRQTGRALVSLIFYCFGFARPREHVRPEHMPPSSDWFQLLLYPPTAPTSRPIPSLLTFPALMTG